MGKEVKWQSVNELREKFLSFFESKDHLRLNSFSLVPHNDNSLLLINSGMAPLKPYFTGQEVPPRRRVTTCQKCIRTGDIENVGKTARHGTFFEMLGNFSFGDYFKTEAIHWSWEFLTEVVGLDPERLYPSVYLDDDEAFEIWNKEIGVPADRIYRFGKEDNFWEHGKGPCGPCSEIYYDRGEKYGTGPEDVMGGEGDRFMEIWNNVFTQFENDGEGNYTELSQKNIDTGMGLERLAVQDVDSIFDVDTLEHLRNEICKLAGIEYKQDPVSDISIRVITDHIRSVTMMVSDGILPSNEGRGYVLRRLLRRAARHGRLLKIDGLFLADLAKVVIADSSDAYPQLEEKKEELPYELLPGPQAKYRCCVYKEREVVRQRIRLAEGKCPSETPKTGKDNVVQVIEAACADCPLSHYIVTDNCRKCMAKACQQACKFGAVSMGRDRAYIDPDKCKECGQCAKACPYNAIADLIRPCKKICPVGAITMDENGICEIDDSKCIKCGHCIHACPFGAIGSKTDIVDVIKAITSGKKVVAMVAPAIEGSFGADITMDSIRTACKKVGFSDMVEVALGGDMTAGAEAKEWLEANKEGKKMTTSCCPAFVNMIKKHYPELTDNISTTVSPMCAVSRMLKSKDKDTVTVFIGPCIAKKDERRNKDLEGNADYVLTVGEYRAMLRAKDVKIEAEANSSQQASVYGKRFGNGGGVAAAVVECMKELGEDPSKFTIEKCSGGAECKKALTLLKMDRLQADFVEGMACEGGCVGGHHRSSKNEMLVAKDRDKLLSEADDRKIYDNLKSYDMEAFSMHAE